MHKSQFRKIDPYDWFCAPGSHIYVLICLFSMLIYPPTKSPQSLTIFFQVELFKSSGDFFLSYHNVSFLQYPLSTSRNQVLVQSQCSCRFLVGSTGEPFKNRLLFHRLESQYRARCYVTYVSCVVSLARQRQTQQTCSRCISATQIDRHTTH